MSKMTPTEMWLCIADMIWDTHADLGDARECVNDMWSSLFGYQREQDPERKERLRKLIVEKMSMAVDAGVVPEEWVEAMDGVNIPPHITRRLHSVQLLEEYGVEFDKVSTPEQSLEYWRKVADLMGRYAHMAVLGPKVTSFQSGQVSAGMVWYLIRKVQQTPEGLRPSSSPAAAMLAQIIGLVLQNTSGEVDTIRDPLKAKLGPAEHALADSVAHIMDKADEFRVGDGDSDFGFPAAAAEA